MRLEGDRVTAKSQIQTQPNPNPQNKSQPNTHHLQPPTTYNHRNLYPPPKQHHTPPKLQFNPQQQTLAIESHNQRQASKSHDPRQVNSSERKPWPTATNPSKQNVAFKIGEVGLRCLWIGDEGGVDRWWLVIGDEGRTAQTAVPSRSSSGDRPLSLWRCDLGLGSILGATRHASGEISLLFLSLSPFYFPGVEII